MDCPQGRCIKRPVALVNNQPHDFMIVARRVIEDTVGHKLEVAALHSKAHPARERSSSTTILRVIESIVDRNSIRYTVRVTGIPQNQVKAMVAQVGHACAEHRRAWIRGTIRGNLCCKATLVLQEKNREPVRDDARLKSARSAWTWTCIDSKTGFVPLWLVGPHNPETMRVLVEEAGGLGGGRIHMEGRDSAVSSAHQPVFPQIPRGPDEQTSTKHSSEILRIADPWLTTISDGLARKVRRHAAALELLFTVHNFATGNAAGVSPAMAAGIADHIWTIAEIVDLVR